MTVLYIFSIDDIAEENAITSLSSGSHIIGRGDLLQVFDKRVSRKHAVIDVGDDAISITPVHVNPCFFKAANGSTLRVLDKDQKTLLSDGDHIGLLADSFWFKVKVKQETGIIQQISDIHNDTTLELIRSTSTSPTSKQGPFKRSHKSDEQSIASPENDHSANKKQKLSPFPSNIELEVPSTSTTDVGCRDEYNRNQSTNEVKIESEQVLEVPTTDTRIKQETDLSCSINKQSSATNCAKTEPNDDKTTTNNLTLKNFDIGGNPAVIKTENITTDVGGNSNDFSDLPAPSATSGDENEAVIIKKDDEEKGKDDKGDNKIADSADKNAPSGSGAAPPKSRRERCWYGQGCYRKNPIHRQDFTHPGDDDYDSDPDDDRPNCPFGGACYRRNLSHRRQFKHPNRPAPRPTNAPPSPPSSPNQPTPKRKRAPKQRNTATNDDGSDLDNDYDYDDPFINDDSSDEYKPSQDLSDDSDSDLGDSQEPDEESQERKRMLKEAKKFTKGKK